MKEDESTDELQKCIDELQDRIVSLEKELDDSERMVPELQRMLERIEQNRSIDEIREEVARINDILDELIKNHSTHDLSEVEKVMDSGEEYWNEELPDDPTDLTDF